MTHRDISASHFAQTSKSPRFIELAAQEIGRLFLIPNVLLSLEALSKLFLLAAMVNIFSKGNFTRNMIVMASLYLTGQAAVYGGVDVISLETEFDIEGSVYYEVSVKCSDVEELQNLRKEATSRAKWCSQDEQKFCSKKKVAAARAVCRRLGSGASSEPKTSIVKDQENSRSSDVATQRDRLLKEQMLIEAQRIEIENKRLQLVERELSLKRAKSTL